MLVKQSLFIILILFFSCSDDKKISKENNNILINIEEKELSLPKINVQNKKIELNTDSKKVVENWQEYQSIAEFISKFYNTTTTEILSNSQQLSALAQQIKDSIRITKFDIPSFRIRLNVFHNETLRLADMDSIPSITQKEIIQENENIIHAFSAINAKINAMVNKEKLETDLEEFDSLFILKDSIEKETTTIKNNEKREKGKRKMDRRRINPINKKDNQN